MSTLEELSTAIASIAERAGTSAVRVGAGWRNGSGVVVASGAVLTNAHNVRSEEVTVTFTDGRQQTGKLAGLDVDGDLAVINVDTGTTPELDWSGTSAQLGSLVF